MVKLVFCCRRRPELSFEQFSKRWLEVHGPLVRRMREHIPQMRRYVQSHTIPGAPSEMLRASRGAKPPYDGITETAASDIDIDHVVANGRFRAVRP